MVLIEATARVEFTDQTACCISLMKVCVPARLLRKGSRRCALHWEVQARKDRASSKAVHGCGRGLIDTVLAYILDHPDNFMPRHAGNSRKRLPMAALGDPQSSRARLSDRIATGLRL